jgi:hypothetical protein
MDPAPWFWKKQSKSFSQRAVSVYSKAFAFVSPHSEQTQVGMAFRQRAPSKTVLDTWRTLCGLHQKITTQTSDRSPKAWEEKLGESFFGKRGIQICPLGNLENHLHIER